MDHAYTRYLLVFGKMAARNEYLFCLIRHSEKIQKKNDAMKDVTDDRDDLTWLKVPAAIVFDFDVMRCLNPGDDPDEVHYFMTCEDGTICLYAIPSKDNQFSGHHHQEEDEHSHQVPNAMRRSASQSNQPRAHLGEPRELKPIRSIDLTQQSLYFTLIRTNIAKRKLLFCATTSNNQMCLFEDFKLVRIVDTGHVKQIMDVKWLDILQEDGTFKNYISTCGMDGNFKIWEGLQIVEGH